MAQAASSQPQRGQKVTLGVTEGEADDAQIGSRSNETVTRKVEEEKAQRLQAQKQWNEVVQESASSGKSDPASGGKKSWADEVEEEEMSGKKA